MLRIRYLKTEFVIQVVRIQQTQLDVKSKFFFFLTHQEGYDAQVRAHIHRGKTAHASEKEAYTRRKKTHASGKESPHK